jgi:hypothetical protein
MDKYIYIKNNIISHNLCNEIIDNYNNIDKSKIFNHNIQKKNYIMNYESILITEDKIIKIINNELIEELNYYHNLINYDKKNIILDNTYYINKLNKDSSQKTYNYDLLFKKENNTYYSFLKFIIFLNNNNSNIIINKDIIVKPEVGKLLIFPCGWCFPYKYSKSYDQDNLFISGFIYSKFK